MSSSLSSSLTIIQTQMNFYGYSILIILGSIGNIFILILFNQQHHNACTIYLINSAVTNQLYLIINGIFRIFSFSYNDGTQRALILCKISNYAPAFLGQVTKTILILACIDRYMITSNRANFRAFSTPKRAKWMIFFTYIFWAIFASHIPICMTISHGQCIKVGLYITLYAIYAILFIGLIPSITLCVFAYLIHRNMKQLRTRIQPTTQDNVKQSIQRRDRDLLILIIAEVFVFIITTTLFPLIHLETMISQYILPSKSLQYIQVEIFVLNVAFILICIFSATPFYIYMISSKSFRQDFKQLIMINYQKIRKQTFDTTVHPKTNQTLTQHETRLCKHID